jgi:iron-sulfur-dependent L-serine dehydratase single chain form
LGLEGESPDTINVAEIENRVDGIRKRGGLLLGNRFPVPFTVEKDLILNKTTSLPQHPNGIRFTLLSPTADLLLSREYFSVGGGFVQPGDVYSQNIFYRKDEPGDQDKAEPHLPFSNAEDLLRICESNGMSIAQVVWKNELQWRSEETVKRETLELWNVMKECIRNGVEADDTKPLPGGLKVLRRAPGLYRKLINGNGTQLAKMEGLDHLSCYAIAVNEENAAGGRVVTAPTNGAAGIIPAVLKYYLDFLHKDDDPSVAIIKYLHTAGAIGMLYKRGASISAAEVGCQGEIGVASSMSAGGLAALLGGTALQVENAAEIAMEHSLGLTCDPVAGLVQIPCIERNAVGAGKAVSAAQLAMNGDGTHRISLDRVIEVMRQTGMDMQDKYKETSQGGLAVNYILC